MGNKGAKLKKKELKSLVEKTKCAYMLCRTACWCLACWRVQQLAIHAPFTERTRTRWCWTILC